VSYNVRETVPNPPDSFLFENLERTLDADYTQTWVLIQDLLLADNNPSFEFAVERL